MGNEVLQERVLSLRKYLFWLITGVLLFLCYKILNNFLIPLISAYMTAFLLRPLFLKLQKKMRPVFAAATCVALITLLLLMPMVWVVKKIVEEAKNPSLSFSPIETLSEHLKDYPLLAHVNIDLVKDRITNSIVSFIQLSLSYIPYRILGIAITLFALFYILINWDFLSRQVYLFIPFKEKERAMQELSTLTHRILFGYALVAITELVIASIGFTVFKVKFALLYAFLISVLAFVPGLGPAMVWVPLAIYYAISGNYFTLIGVAITGFIISVGIDTFLSAKIVGDRAKINPLVLLLGILGGVPIFGIFGFIIGPIILVYTVKLIQEGLTQEHKAEVKLEQAIASSAPSSPPSSPKP